MYKIGDLIVYGSTGICRVMEIGPPKFRVSDENRLYYALKPLYQDGIIYTPVDGKVFMRPIISAKEANRLIGCIPAIRAETCHERSTTTLAAHYESILKTHNCADLMELSMSLYAKKKNAEQQNRKFGLIDERFMKRTEDLLFGELAAALSIPREEVPAYIKARIHQNSKE